MNDDTQAANSRFPSCKWPIFNTCSTTGNRKIFDSVISLTNYHGMNVTVNVSEFWDGSRPSLAIAIR